MYIPALHQPIERELLQTSCGLFQYSRHCLLFAVYEVSAPQVIDLTVGMFVKLDEADYGWDVGRIAEQLPQGRVGIRWLYKPNTICCNPGLVSPALELRSAFCRKDSQNSETDVCLFIACLFVCSFVRLFVCSFVRSLTVGLCPNTDALFISFCCLSMDGLRCLFYSRPTNCLMC